MICMAILCDHGAGLIWGEQEVEGAQGEGTQRSRATLEVVAKNWTYTQT